MACAQVRERKNINNLTKAELTKFRDALRAIQSLPASDNRSFAFIAGLHGFPGSYCPHHRATFLTWHRAYLLALETALRDFGPDVTLPYWDWSSPGTGQIGIPKAFRDATYTGGDNKKHPNPLRKFRFRDANGNMVTTSRDPGSKTNLGRIGEVARRALNLTTFNRFQETDVDSIQNAHDGLHGWVSGTMGSIDYSAYDPIFFCHHANVDRLWAEWQRAHGNGSMPTVELNATLTPWSFNGRGVLDASGDLCYRYASVAVFAKVPTAAKRAAAAGPPRVLAKTFASLPKQVGTAELRLKRVRFPTSSFEIRVFVNQRSAGAKTPLVNNPAYAGSLYVFGHGKCYGGAGHCNPVARPADDIRGPHHLMPFDMRLDITKQLKVAQGAARVSIVVVDAKDQQMDHSQLRCDGLELLLRD